jgi:predicted phosphodiesterase
VADDPSDAPARPGRRSRLRRWGGRAGWFVFVVAVVLAVAPRLGSSVSTVGPGRVAIGFTPTLHGGTTLALPPVGEARAPTHEGPVRVRLELRSLDVSTLLADGGRVDTRQLEGQIRDDISGAVVTAVVRLAVLAAVVGAAAAALLPRRRAMSIVAGGFVGAVAVVVMAASALPGFDVGEFDELTYQGPLTAGTQLLKTLTSNEGVVGARVDALSNKLAGLYSATLTNSLNDADEVVILHISDLHLNPIGAQLARRLAESFDVDAVVDTGDTTSFGTRFEGPYAELLSNFPVPYLYVAGNHDSMPNRAAIKATPGVTALDRTVVDVKGIEIAGFDDPIITTVEDVPLDQREERELAAAPALQRLVRREHPDVVAVHNPVILQPIVGHVPLAIAGHQHHFRLGARKGTIVSVVGSTGATGLGSLLVDADLPASADLLRFRKGKLVAIDSLEVIGTNGDLTVERHTITEADREGDTADFIGSDVDEAVTPADGEDRSTTTSSTTSTVVGSGTVPAAPPPSGAVGSAPTTSSP